jgi:uncharacterized protein (UPF0332 family)
MGAAQVCFDRGYYNSSVSRAYYAMFQAAQAALTDAGVHRAEWSHAAVQAVFSSELTRRRKIYRVDLARNLAKGLEFRLTADYGTWDMTRSQAAKVLRWGTEFVGHVEETTHHG